MSAGINSAGKQIIRRMQWKPTEDMTPRQTEKALNHAAADFEREIEQGFQLDQKQTFSEYAEYVMALKERIGVRLRTIDRYLELLSRINQAIGHIKLSDLRPQHLNSFYQNLGENGIRKDGEYAVARVNIASLLQSKPLSRSALARRAGIAATTVSAAVGGASISRRTAELIAVAIEQKATDLFCFEKNTSPLSDKTILEYHRLISSIMAQAEKEMLIPYNPAVKATPPKPRRKEPNYFQPDVLDGILDELNHAPLKWRTITCLLIDTGCRRGEAVGLKWDSIDFENEPR